MNILHVTLGNPKQHAGGLNRYCVDLMEQQKKNGNSVSVLYAGTYVPGKKVKIRKKSTHTFSVCGALPVAIVYGIDNPSRYMTLASIDVYRGWLQEVKPEVIHIHSIMGIHKEFFEAAKGLKIPMVFTTHDYYPCCFRCNLVDNNWDICMNSFNAERCQICNVNAGLHRTTQILLQSEVYQIIKKWSGIKKIRKKHIVAIGETKVACTETKQERCSSEDFEKLHIYYRDIMEMVSVVHCNSKFTRDIYFKHFSKLNYEIIPITHCGLKRTHHLRKDSKVLHMSYLGGMSHNKGYYQLRNVLKSLVCEDGAWEIALYGSEYVDIYDDSRIIVKGTFSKDDEEVVWEYTDLLIVPSQCPETFGFVVLEALARGIPVICSDMVGAGYLLGDLIDECVYRHDVEMELVECIKRFLKESYYNRVTQQIQQLVLPTNMRDHCEKMVELYKIAVGL